MKDLLASSDKRILAVLTGGIARPTLTGDVREKGTIRRQVQLMLDDVRQQRALAGAGTRLPPTDVRLVKVDESAGSLARIRSLTARVGQMLLFMLTVLLATMLLSNLVEEKTNKILEVLAAAVPIDAIFVGKLFSMLAVSLVGIAVWAAAVIVGLQLWPSGGGGLPSRPSAGRSSRSWWSSITAPIICCSARSSSASARRPPRSARCRPCRCRSRSASFSCSCSPPSRPGL